MSLDDWRTQAKIDDRINRMAHGWFGGVPVKPDLIRAAYDSGDAFGPMRVPVQDPCPCCKTLIETARGCAAVVISEQTGLCRVVECHCHGSRADGGLCEECYLWTK